MRAEFKQVVCACVIVGFGGFTAFAAANDPASVATPVSVAKHVVKPMSGSADMDSMQGPLPP